MARSAPAYCDPEDVSLGDTPLPRSMTAQQVVDDAADEMDAVIGQRYVLPIEFQDNPEDNADKLVLKQINKTLGLGRLLCLTHSTLEDATVHAYGRRLLGEAKEALERIRTGQFTIDAGVLITTESNPLAGPLITHKDPASYVDQFYGQQGSAYSPHTSWGGLIGG